MAKMMWFGTRDYMTWVVCPVVNMNASKVGWFNKADYLNGGAAIKRSTASHKEYELSWEMKTRAELRIICDFADQLNGTGALYWADPFVMDANMLPQSWAAPFMGALDGVILSGKATRPMSVSTATNGFGYPIKSATYTVGSEAKPTVWVPIPPGYTAWVGVHGAAGTGGVVEVVPTTGATTSAAAVTLTMLSVATDVRVNHSFSSASYNGVNIRLGGSGTVTVSGIIVQLLPTGQTPVKGGYISGQGHSGCQFSEQPQLMQYNAAIDRVGLSVNLVEVQQWL